MGVGLVEVKGIRAGSFRRAVLGSNQPPPGLEPGIPPLMNSRRVTSMQCAGRDSNPRQVLGTGGSTGRSICRSATCANRPPSLGGRT